MHINAASNLLKSLQGPFFYSSDCDNLCVSTSGCVSYVYLAANLWTQGELRGSCTLYSVAPTPNQYVVFTGEASCGMPTTTDTTSSSTMMA